MGTSMGTALPELPAGAGAQTLTLARLLSSLVADGRCFCCGSPTDLMLDTDGLLLVRCAECGAEMGAEEVGGDEAGDSGASDLALRAA